MAINVQNTTNTTSSQYVQLSNDVSTRLYAITNILNSNFTCINTYLKRLFYNQNLIYNTREACHQRLEEQIANIKTQLKRLRIQPQTTIV